MRASRPTGAEGIGTWEGVRIGGRLIIAPTFVEWERRREAAGASPRPTLIKKVREEKSGGSSGGGLKASRPTGGIGAEGETKKTTLGRLVIEICRLQGRQTMPGIVKNPHNPAGFLGFSPRRITACHPLSGAIGSFERGIFRINEHKKWPQADACGHFLVKYRRKITGQNR